MGINKKLTDIIRDKQTQLPTLPIIIDNILKIVSNEKTSSEKLAEFISKDQAIVNKILKVTNSAYYGLAKKINSLSHAITIIGFNEVTSLAIGLSVFSTFGKTGKHGILNMKDLWLHSIGCALISKIIAGAKGPSGDEPSFLNGLLHDMGKIILVEYFPDEYNSVLKDAKKSQVPLHLKEIEKLGLDHAMVAGLLMERWNFPDNLCIPCKFHHNSSACPADYRQQAIQVEIADFLCHKAKIGNSGNTASGNVEKIRKQARFTTRDMDIFEKESLKQRKKTEEFFALIS